MKAQEIFEKKKSKRAEVKNPRILMGIILLLFLSLITQVLTGESVPTVSQLEDRENDTKVKQAANWNQKGEEFYEKKDYKAAVECFQKAVEIDDTKVDYFINLAQAYRDDKKFAEAEQLLKEALEKYSEKKDQKSLLIELAEVHFWWGEDLESIYEYIRAINHYNFAYEVDSIYRPKEAAIELNTIGYLYNCLGKKQMALEYYRKALPISRAVGDRSLEADILNNIGGVFDYHGQEQEALEYYKEALKISRDVGDGFGEAYTLNNIGAVYVVFGMYPKALEYYEKALSIISNIGDRTGEATTLNNIGMVYFNIGRKQKALEYYEKALSINKIIENRVGEANALNNIGAVYVDLGLNLKALEYYQKALVIKQDLGDHVSETDTLHNMGEVYRYLGNIEEALGCFKKALTLSRDVGDRNGEAGTLNSIGVVYSDLGQHQKALEYYQKALTIEKTIEERVGQAASLNNIGGVYSDLGQKQKSLEYYEKALVIWKTIGDRIGEIKTLGNIGTVYFSLGRKKKALKCYKQMFAVCTALGYRIGKAVALNNIGQLYHDLGQKQKALDCFEKSTIILTVVNKSMEAVTLSNLMNLLKDIKNIRLSIFFGKMSTNSYQKLRANISGLKENMQKSYLKSNRDTYRGLIELLINEGRLTESQQVLDMLKEDEYFNYSQKDRSTAEVLSTNADFTEFEMSWLEKYKVLTERFAAISNEHHALKFKNNRIKDEERKFKELDLKLKEETKVYEKFMTQMREAFDRHEKEIKAGKVPPDTLAKEASDLHKNLKYMDENQGGKHAALHYMVYEGRISVILTTPSFQSVKQTDIDEQDFNRMIMAYRNLMMRSGRGVHLLKKKKPDKKIRKYEKQFYDLIFKPVDEELKKYGAANLVVSLDGVLRYLPLGALWDGNSYLLQRYRIAIVTPLSLKNIEDEPIKEKKILGLGAGQGGEGFYELPNVGREIRSIVLDKEKGYEGLITGKALIDDDFTKENLLEQLKNKTYSLVHIASHFKFSPGDETKNRLLLGDGTTLKLSEIRGMGKIFENVKLLVLSACQTGVGGNGEEVDGFGELAQQSGAKSVIASLWPVADESTSDLMITFYSKLKEGKVKSKIEALRQAQLELAGLEDLLQKDNTSIQKLPLKKTKYSHPYYWGPFILMGNWK